CRPKPSEIQHVRPAESERRPTDWETGTGPPPGIHLLPLLGSDGRAAPAIELVGPAARGRDFPGSTGLHSRASAATPPVNDRCANARSASVPRRFGSRRFLSCSLSFTR